MRTPIVTDLGLSASHNIVVHPLSIDIIVTDLGLSASHNHQPHYLAMLAIVTDLGLSASHNVIFLGNKTLLKCEN